MNKELTNTHASHLVVDWQLGEIYSLVLLWGPLVEWQASRLGLQGVVSFFIFGAVTFESVFMCKSVRIGIIP